MKALSLYQPWATLIALGAKKIETRSWKTHYRGPLAIHATKKFPDDAVAQCFMEPFRSILTKHGYIDQKRLWFQDVMGCIVATCNLVSIESVDAIADAGPGVYRCGVKLTWPIPEPERSFGNYSRGRYMWLLDDVKPVDPPIPARGSVALWDWDGSNKKAASNDPQST